MEIDNPCPWNLREERIPQHSSCAALTPPGQHIDWSLLSICFVSGSVHDVVGVVVAASATGAVAYADKTLFPPLCLSNRVKWQRALGIQVIRAYHGIGLT